MSSGEDRNEINLARLHDRREYEKEHRMTDQTPKGDANRWWIATGPLSRGGEKNLGPFVSQELAIKVRTYVEAVEDRDDLWIEVS